MNTTSVDYKFLDWTGVKFNTDVLMKKNHSLLLFSGEGGGGPDYRTFTFWGQGENLVSCVWDLGDGSHHFGCDEFIHTFPGPGEYPIQYTATTIDGYSTTTTYRININHYSFAKMMKINQDLFEK